MDTHKGKLLIPFVVSTGVLVLLLSVLQGIRPQVGRARALADTVGGTISANETWTRADSPYTLTDDVIVASGVILTIESGVVVKGASNYELQVQGHLVAVGTDSDPITFTSVSESGSGDWPGLVFNGGTGELRHVTVRYGGQYVNSAGVCSNIVVSGVLIGEVYMEDTRVLSGSSGIGVFVDHGLYITDSHVVVSGTTFSGNGVSPTETDYAFYATGDHTAITLTGNTFQNNAGYAARVRVDHLRETWMTGTTFIDNDRDRVLIAGGTLGQSATLLSQTGLEAYELGGDVTVSGGVTLTIKPGVMVMGGNDVEFLVAGHLQAVGTAAEPITFTSKLNTGPEQWSGLVFDGGTGELRHVTVRYGGQNNSVLPAYNHGSNIAVRNVLTGQVRIESSRVISEKFPSGLGIDYGLYITDSHVVVSGTAFVNNGNSVADFALYATGASSVVSITNGEFEDNGGYAISVEAGHLDQIQMRGNVFSDTAEGRRVRVTGGVLAGSAILMGQTGMEGYELSGDVTISEGVTLSVQPGVMVMGGENVELRVAGHLRAVGTETERVTFTSKLNTGPEQWSGLAFDGGTGELYYVTVRYGGHENSVLGVGSRKSSNITVLGVLTGQVRIENSRVLSEEFTDGLGGDDCGLYVQDSHVVINGTTFRDNGDTSNADCALFATGASTVITVTGSTIEDNNGDGVHMAGGRALLSCVTLQNNGGHGIHVDGSAISVTVVGSVIEDDNATYYDIRNDTLVTVTARYNWWGGSGPDVSDLVDTDPELLAPTCVVDLMATKSDWPDPVFVEAPLTYTITVVNNSPSPATDVVLTDSLPLSVTFGSALPGQGDCTGTDDAVTCTLDSLAGSAYAGYGPVGVTIVVTPSVEAEGVRANTVRVASQEFDPWTTNSTTTITTTVDPLADLAVGKWDALDPAGLGELLTYTVVVTNHGPSTATGVVLTDTLPGIASLVSASSEQGICGATNPITCTLAPLGRDATVTVSIVVTPTQAELMTNTVRVEAAQFDPQLDDNVFTETTLVGTADLWVSKSDAPDPARVGYLLTYTVFITNEGPNDATAVLLTDTLPLSVTDVLTASSQGSCTVGEGLVVCDLGLLEDQSAAAITVTVRPTEAGTILNEVGVSSLEYDPDLDNSGDKEGTVVDPVADLAVAKGAWPEPVGLGEALTFTLVVTNNGPSTATGMRLTDTLPLSVTAVSAGFSQGSCAAESGSVICNLGALDAKASAAVTITVEPTATGTLTNLVEVAGVAFDPYTGNNAASQSTTVVPAADMEVSKGDTPDPLAVGDTLTYTVVVTNHGPSTATDVVLTDTLPGGVDFGRASPGCSGTGPVTCALDSLAQGAVEMVTIVVTPAVAGAIINTVEVGGVELDPRLADNAAQARTIVGTAGLAVVKSATPASVLVGHPLTYTILITNGGPDAATGVWLADALSPGVNLDSVTSSGGDCSQAEPLTITCDLDDLASSAGAVVTVVVTPAAAGPITNTVSVAGDQVDPVADDNADTARAEVEPVADLSVAKFAGRDAVVVKEPLTYTIVITNNGPSAATELALTDTLPTGVTLLAASSGCSGTGPVTCTLDTLNAGITATITITIEPVTRGIITNTVSVMGKEFDPDSDNNVAGVETVVTSSGKVYLPVVLKSR